MKERFKNAPFCMALVLLLLFAGKAFAAEDWSRVYRQNKAVYPKGPGPKEALAQAEGAGVPVEEVSAILARSAGSVSAQDFGAFVGRLSAARKEGLPSHPFAEKVLEGLAKSVPPQLILSALDRQMETYREAKRIVGLASKGGKGGDAIDSIALAMQRGVSPKALSELYHAVSPGPEGIIHSAQAMADLKDLGFSEQQGRRMVAAAVRAGYFTRGEPLFMAVVSHAQKRGLSNDVIVDEVEADLRWGYSLSEISQRLRGGDLLSPSMERNRGMNNDLPGGSRSVLPGPSSHGPLGPSSHGRGGGRR